LHVEPAVIVGSAFGIAHCRSIAKFNICNYPFSIDRKCRMRNAESANSVALSIKAEKYFQPTGYFYRILVINTKKAI